MKKPTYPRIQGRDVTIKTKKGYRTFYNCLDVNDYKKGHTFVHDHADDIWIMKHNYLFPADEPENLIHQFVHEDKNGKATVKVYLQKNYSWIKWVGGRIDKQDRVQISSNKWRTTIKWPTPYAPDTGFKLGFFHGGITKKQAIKWVMAQANKSNVRKCNKAIKQMKEAA
jgi:hypothetical protein